MHKIQGDILNPFEIFLFFYGDIMENEFEKICEKIDGLEASTIRCFVVLDETVCIDVYIHYEKEGIDCECSDFVFGCAGYDKGMKLARQVAEKYGAELIV